MWQQVAKQMGHHATHLFPDLITLLKDDSIEVGSLQICLVQLIAMHWICTRMPSCSFVVVSNARSSFILVYVHQKITHMVRHITKPTWKGAWHIVQVKDNEWLSRSSQWQVAKGISMLDDWNIFGEIALWGNREQRIKKARGLWWGEGGGVLPAVERHSL